MRPIDHLNPYVNRLSVKPALKQKAPTTGFKTALTQALDIGKQAETPLKISKHAAERMAERRITIEPKVWQAIYEKVSEAKSMGIKESLVVTKDHALVVSPQNETVITALNREEASKQIFSNIDGAILLG